ncbi:hypothetical protein KSS87_013033 [Heliosperma pusillum]|nr:hypothetical protein KSS87_013033 [Heliosperma pusillum]
MYQLRRAMSTSNFRNHKFFLLRTFSNILRPSPLREPSKILYLSLDTLRATPSYFSRTLCSRTSDVADVADSPSAIDYRSLLQENEFHELADSTIHHLLEKLEEYGDSVDIDGFDIDYGNEVLTMKLGNLGSYVVNKQTPNRQICGPSRFDWDRSAQAWIYRRNKATLFRTIESELEKLCGEPVALS